MMFSPRNLLFNIVNSLTNLVKIKLFLFLRGHMIKPNIYIVILSKKTIKLYFIVMILFSTINHIKYLICLNNYSHPAGIRQH